MAYFFIALAIVLGDQILKRYIVANLAVGEAIPLIPGVIQLTYARNTGMSFNLLQDHQWILLVLNPIVIGVLIFLLARGYIKGKVQSWAMVCVIAGAAGNMLDRFIYGFVVDMFEPVFIRFAVFNLADCFIVCGGIVFVIAYLLEELKKSKKTSGRMED